MSDPMLRHMSVRIIHKEFPSCFEAGQCPEDPDKELLGREISNIKETARLREQALGIVATCAAEGVEAANDAATISSR